MKHQSNLFIRGILAIVITIVGNYAFKEYTKTHPDPEGKVYLLVQGIMVAIVIFLLLF
jgi:hypothetical protein